MKTGAIVARYQSPYLTLGHKLVIDTAVSHSDDLVFVLGATEAKFTTNYPLSNEIRRDMVLEEYPLSTVLFLHDHDDSKIWSENLDKLLSVFENVTLFGSRDSFISSYYGKLPYVHVEPARGISATTIRESLRKYKTEFNNQSFREGIIHAVEDKYPTVFPTVDIAVLKYTEGEETLILLGRKPNHTKWCFMGGFVDPKDSSYEDAAWRELHEEVQFIETHELKYLASTKIDDTRYRKSNDGIMTTLFLTYYLGGNPIAGDDLEEVKWYTFAEAEEVIGRHHKKLLEIVKSKI